MNPFHWTKDEIAAESRYRYEERLGILCGSATSTPEQEALARAEAHEAVRRLREKQSNDKQWCAWCGVWGNHASGSCPKLGPSTLNAPSWDAMIAKLK